MPPAAHYVIKIKGSLHEGWIDWFDDMTIQPESGNETSISGLVTDQSALVGLINRIHDLGLALISVNPQAPDT